MSIPANIRKIAIVGAGPTGLAVARYLLAEKHFCRICVFEQQNNVGGVWNYTPPHVKKPLDIPQTNPHQPLEEPFWLPQGKNGVLDWSKGVEPVFTTPMYDHLETNIPKNLMQYSDQEFPPDSQLFPTHETVLRYLEGYASEVKHLISFQSQVMDIRLRDGHHAQWDVQIKDLPSRAVTTETYDAVVIANGHFTVPIIPPIPGIAEWDKSYPHTIMHSKFFRKPGAYRDKKVVVVGNSASGQDISAQIGAVCKRSLLLSRLSESPLSSTGASWKEELPEIVEFLPSNTRKRAVKFANGRIEEGIDAIIFATGYYYSIPFMRSFQPPLIDDGTRTVGVWKHFIHVEYPTLAIPGLNQRIVPFPFVENQAAVIARLWSGRLSLPSKDKRKAWEKSEIAARGSGRKFHLLNNLADVEYINEMHDWTLEASRRDGLENDGKGKVGPRWGERDRWIRERCPLMKRAFAERGEERHSIHTVEELGFDFHA